MQLHTGAYGHHRRVSTESWLWEKRPLPHRGMESASAAWRSDILPMSYIPTPMPIKAARETTTLFSFSCLGICLRVQPKTHAHDFFLWFSEGLDSKFNVYSRLEVKVQHGAKINKDKTSELCEVPVSKCQC